MFHRLAVVAFALAAVPSMAIAAKVTVGSASINLPTPTGFCDLSATAAPDKGMFDTLSGLVAKSKNKMLAISADCRQLAEWRTKKRQFLDDFANYQAPFSTIESSAEPEPVKTTCSVLREQGTKIASNQAPDLKANIEKALKDVKLNEMTFVGILGEDAGACYGGLIQKLKVNDNTDRTQITLFAATVVKNKSIFVYRIALYNSDTVTNTLEKLKTIVAALYAANSGNK